MSYDFKALKPKRKGQEIFSLGAFSFPVLLGACGYLFPAVNLGAQWLMAGNAGELDKRFEGKNYPPILANDGFEVSEKEAKIMARMARNYVAIQRRLSDDHNEHMTGVRKIRDDFVEKFDNFADWAEQSGGFKIY